MQRKSRGKGAGEGGHLFYKARGKGIKAMNIWRAFPETAEQVHRSWELSRQRHGPGMGKEASAPRGQDSMERVVTKEDRGLRG